MKRAWVIVALCALAGCGSSSDGDSSASKTTATTTATRTTTATATPSATATPAGPEAVASCPGTVDKGWKELKASYHGDLLAAQLGSGKVGIVFANDSGNNLCPWLPFAQTLATRYHVAVFQFGDEGSIDREALVLAKALKTKRFVMIGASVGARATITTASRNPKPMAAAISLSAERQVGRLGDILGQAKKVRVPSLLVGSKEDGYTNFAIETKQLYKATPAEHAQMLLVPGGDHGVDLLSDQNGPRVRAEITRFIKRFAG